MTRNVIIDRLALNAVGSKYQEFLHPRLKGKWRSKGLPRAATGAPAVQKAGSGTFTPQTGKSPSEPISPAAPGAQTKTPAGQVAKAAIAQKPDAAAGVRPGMAKVQRAGDKWVMEDGSPLPKYLEGVNIFAGWSNVQVSTDPKAELLVTAFDSKGRRQSLYSKAHWTKAAAVKFARTREGLQKREAIIKENNVNRTDPAKREDADVMMLILQTGIRPGSTNDTKAAVKAYGATTLEGRHVVVAAGKVRLRFTGKKGVSLDIPVEDKEIAQMLQERKKSAGDSGKLFATDNNKLLKYAHSLDGGKFKTKDFRTIIGTKTAIDEIAKVNAVPKTKKEYVAQVKMIAKIVSEKLGNTPTVALQSYIDPSVFSAWRIVE